MGEPGDIRSYFIRTFGCQMNVHDSDRIAQLLQAAGMQAAPSAGEADLIVINSCSVRAKPEHKALSETGKYQGIHKKPGARIVLAGCVAQQEGKRLLARAPYLDAIVGPDAIYRLPDILRDLASRRGPVVAVDEHDTQNPCFVPLVPGSKTEVFANVTIMKGCNNYCSYCVVPFVRGREVSRPMADILREVEILSSRGCREVMLLGQNVNSYRDDTQGASFPALLLALDRQAAVDRIRFMTSHPKDVSPELTEVMAGSNRICEHIHLALQSGSDRILRLMNRNYTRDEFIQKAMAFRKANPAISITTDVIVGFPSETEEDFSATIEAVETVGFEQAFSFSYSPRPQTAAAKLSDDVPPEEKARRLSELQKNLIKRETARLSMLVGGDHQLLIEGPSRRDPAEYCGRTRSNWMVNFQSDQNLAAGELVLVRTLEVRGHTLWGRDTSLSSSGDETENRSGLTNRPIP